MNLFQKKDFFQILKHFAREDSVASEKLTRLASLDTTIHKTCHERNLSTVSRAKKLKGKFKNSPSNRWRWASVRPTSQCHIGSLPHHDVCRCLSVIDIRWNFVCSLCRVDENYNIFSVRV